MLIDVFIMQSTHVFIAVIFPLEHKLVTHTHTHTYTHVWIKILRVSKDF